MKTKKTSRLDVLLDVIDLVGLFIAGVVATVSAVWSKDWHWAFAGLVVSVIAIALFRIRRDLSRMTELSTQQESVLKALATAASASTEQLRGVQELLTRPGLAEDSFT